MNGFATSRRQLVLAALCAAGWLAAANDVAAQQQLRLPRSSVEVDWSVLDELDRVPASTSAPRAAPPAPRRAAPPAPTARSPQQSRRAPDQAAQAPARRTPAATSAARAPSSFSPPSPPPVFSEPAPRLAPPIATAPTAAPPAAAAPVPPPAPPPVVAASPPPPVTAPPVAAARPSPPPAPAPAVAAAPPAAPPPPPPVAAARPSPLPPAAAAAVVPAPPPPAPPASIVARPAEPTQQVAALPAAGAGSDRLAQVVFASGAAELPDGSRDALAQAAARLGADEATRLLIVAYAGGGDESGNQARRLSLSRALAVRSYLIDRGVKSTRMDVRALGRVADETPADRVDLVLARR